MDLTTNTGIITALQNIDYTRSVLAANGKIRIKDIDRTIKEVTTKKIIAALEGSAT